MSEKKAPAIIKRDSVQNWERATNYVPQVGMVIVYDFDDGTVGIKLADGKSLVGDLPFLNSIEKPKQDNIRVEKTTLYLN